MQLIVIKLCIDICDQDGATIPSRFITGRFITGPFNTGQFISECEKQLAVLDAFEELAAAMPQHQGMDELTSMDEQIV